MLLVTNDLADTLRITIRIVKQAQFKLSRQNTTNGTVDIHHIQLTFLHLTLQGFIRRVPNVYINTSRQSHFSSSFGAGSCHMECFQTVDRTPVRICKTFKAQFSTQDIGHKVGRTRHRDSVISAIATHDRNRIGFFDDTSERIHIQITQFTLTTGYESTVQSACRRTVCNEMLGHTSYSILLETANETDPHFRYKVRIFSESLFHTSPAQLARNVQHRRQDLTNPHHTCFCRFGFRHLADQVGIPCAPLCDSLWEYSTSVLQNTMNTFCRSQDRNTQTGLVCHIFMYLLV